MNFLLFFILIVSCAGLGNLSAQTKDTCSPGFYWDGQKCISCTRPCSTGLIGACGRGLTKCDEGKVVCETTIKPGERIEVCNGEDDDCDGGVDEGFDKDKDGFTTCGGDCDDRSATIHPDAVERCDGIDNDCNGIVDDGFNIGSICTVGRGTCAQKGKRKCSPDGAGVMCDAQSGTPKQELCDGYDNDCDGVIDNGLGDIACGIGACKQTVASCKDGKANRCVPLKPTADLCGDNIDNDCDGRLDEDFTGLGKSCRAGQGMCERTGALVCSDDKLSLRCNAVPGPPQEEICGNRLDEDCNGVADDAVGLNQQCDNGQVGECRRGGTTICDAKRVVCSARRVEPKEERCDGVDNDCDGEIDEGVRNACGGCGALQANVGDTCKVPGADSCGVGVWECSKEEMGKLICTARFDRSEGVACNDGNACNVSDYCIDGACYGGALLSCDDQNPCTQDRCEAEIGCIHEPIGGGFKNICGSCAVLEAEVGESCNLANLSGVCAKGEYQCMPENEMACVQTIFGSNEICNGIDDDCDGLIDEDMGETSCGIGACKVTVANCANGKLQACAPRLPSVETPKNMGSDDDCNGVVDDIAGVASSVGRPIFNPKKTRAAMLPWTDVSDAVVTSDDLKYSWLLVSGGSSDKSGIAALFVKKIFEGGQIQFRTCALSGNEILRALTVTDANDLFASSQRGYYYFPKISSQLSTAGACNLKSDILLNDEVRPWTNESCRVQRIVSIASTTGEIAGGVVCLRGAKFNFGLDIISLLDGSLEHRFIPLWEASSSIDSANVIPLASGGFAVIALIEGRTALALCKKNAAGWGCTKRPEIKKPLLALSKTDTPLFASTDGSIYKLSVEKEALEAIEGGSYGAVTGGVLLSSKEGDIVLVKDSVLTTVSSVSKEQNLLPESYVDDVISGGEFTFANPHALTAIHAKEYGGGDLFAAFDILSGANRIGTMGFFYWNENEPPHGTISDVAFDGGRGVAKLDFADPDGDPMNFSVHIKARHGGSLDHWIESVDQGLVRFSAGGEAASSVGVWPIRLIVEVTDSGGASVTSTAQIAHDGTVESIQEVSR